MSELSIKINGQLFNKWNKFKVQLNYNSIASLFSFEGLIISENQKKLFKPLTYYSCEVFLDKTLILTGTVLNTSTKAGNNISLGSISGYSKCGVLEDCPIPVEVYPLQYDGLSLKEIAEKICKPFGVTIAIDSVVSEKMDKKYDTITLESDKSIKDLICELAKQKDIIVTHNEKGELLFTKLNINKPSIATFLEDIPATEIALNVNGQGLHSSITAQKQTSIDTDVAGEETITNPLISAYRPINKAQTTGTNDDTLSVAKRLRATELQAIKLTINTDRWTWYDGRKLYIIKPNEIIHVQSPTNFIKNRTKFFVESVSLEGNEQGINATINAVLPECYSGDEPINIFA